jgi:magnesium transporter
MKKRLPWLGALLVLGMLVSSVVGIFEDVVAQIALIVCFQSLVLDMAGNVGTQSLAVTIRVLMDEDITPKQKWQLIAKEIRVGFCNGLLLGTASFVFIGLYVMLAKHQPARFAFAVSLCVGVALLVAMLISSLVGTVVPILFKQMKIDPAVASGPFITTINDLVAVVSYYGLAWILLINVLKFV